MKRKMKRTALLVIAVLLAFCNSFAGGELRIMESLVMPSRILGQDVKFSVCLPLNYYDGKQRQYPVVYLLHGLGDDETSWLEYGRISQFADEEVKDGEISSMIFIMPDGYTNYYVNDYKGAFPYQDMFVKELVPYVDSMFRTIPDRQHRALMGYSMGGFGALILHLQHPDVFGASVPLSISIRTDEQYMTEDASGWDDQWGRLFGAPGLTGKDRITEYYKQNNPFYIIPRISPADYPNYHIYIDNGDKEQTLCRSNEELHILMRSLEFPHEYRVRDGGHSFSYWCSALPNALRYLSDAFESKPYRGDIVIKTIVPLTFFNDKDPLIINNDTISYYTPAEYSKSDRLYPVLYFAGNITSLECLNIMSAVDLAIQFNKICPVILVFLPANTAADIKTLVPELESRLRIRPGYRFRSLAGFEDEAPAVLSAVINQEQFSSCILADPFLSKQQVTGLLKDMKPEVLGHTPLYIYSPDKGKYYEGNGNLHMVLRDMNVKHEYRVAEGEVGFDRTFGGLTEMIRFASDNFHK